MSSTSVVDQIKEPVCANSHHALLVPDVYHMICSHLEKKDCAKLLRVSRRNFTLTLPAVWKATDLQSLLFLIPEAQAVTEDDPLTLDSWDPHRVIHIPSDVTLTRFNIYSPHVKAIGTHGRVPSIHYPKEWPAMLPNPLLPKPQRLTIDSHFDWDDDDWRTTLAWISQLVNPDLLSCDMYSQLSDLSPYYSNPVYSVIPEQLHLNLIHLIPRTCTSVQSIQIPPSSHNTEEIYQQAYYNIAIMAELRSIVLTLSRLDEEFICALGRLKRLENLSLTAIQCESQVNDESLITLPSHSFPSLQRLVLFGFDYTVMHRIRQCTALFRRLTTADLILKGVSLRENQRMFRRSIMIVETLCRGNPLLQHLTVHPLGYRGSFGVCLSVLDALKSVYHPRSLNLGKLEFGLIDSYRGAVLDPLDYGGDELINNNTPEAQWTAFLATVPSLEELHLHQEDLKQRPLDLIALLLPCLRLLVVRSIGHIDEVDQSNRRDSAIQPILIKTWSFFGDQSNRYFGPNNPTPVNVARYLCRLWPNVTCEAMHDSYLGMPRTDIEVFARLKKAIWLIQSGGGHT